MSEAHSDDDPYGLDEPAGEAGGSVTDLGAAPTLEEVVLQLTAGVEDLAERVEQLEHERAQDLDPDTLPEWVDWLRETYALREKVPSRWSTVPGVHQELAALRAFHVSCYDKNNNPRRGASPVQWHDALARVLERIGSKWMAYEGRRTGAAAVAAASEPS